MVDIELKVNINKESPMMNLVNAATQFKNAESPFTELFALLKKRIVLSEGFPSQMYETQELKVMYQHVDNAIEIVLQGLQDLGQLLGLAAQDKKKSTEGIYNIGFFISAVSNLAEALSALRSDADYVLKQRKELHC